MTGHDGVLDGRQDRIVVAHDAREDGLVGGDTGHQVGPQLGLDAARPIARGAQLAQVGGAAAAGAGFWSTNASGRRFGSGGERTTGDAVRALTREVAGRRGRCRRPSAGPPQPSISGCAAHRAAGPAATAWRAREWAPARAVARRRRERPGGRGATGWRGRCAPDARARQPARPDGARGRPASIDAVGQLGCDAPLEVVGGATGRVPRRQHGRAVLQVPCASRSVGRR